MTNKERFLRTIAGKDIDMLPIQCDFSASGLEKYLRSKEITNVSDLELLNFFDNHVLYAYMNGATLQMKTKKFNNEKIIYDEWNCGWDTSQDLFYCTHPLEDWDKLENYNFPNPDAEGYLDYAEAVIKEYADKFIVTSYHFCCLFERASILRGFENLLMDLVDEDSRIIEVLDRITDFQIRLAKRYISLGVNCGRIVDDYGSQNNMIISPALWRKIIKPRIAKIYAVYKNAGIPVIHHSCGNVTDIIEDLIEIGMDVLNPVQPNVMDIKEISERFGARLTFFGGVCNQEIIPYGTREEIDAHVEFLVKTLGKHGKYIIAPSNGITDDVPLENIKFFYEAAQKYRHI